MKKYNIIYADPPWSYRTYSKKGQGRSAESHYPTMRLEDIMALPVSELAAKDCTLFMWVTFPCLQEAFQVLEAWGFTYKTVAFVWVKQNRISDKDTLPLFIGDRRIKFGRIEGFKLNFEVLHQCVIIRNIDCAVFLLV